MAMSLKPPKRGDLKKSWLKPRRDTPKKIQPEYHLITTEGISTEPAYFQGVKNTINSKYRGRVQLDIIGVGDNTLNLLQKVKQKVAKSSNICTYGLSMLLTILLHKTLIRLSTFAILIVTKKLLITRFGQTNALNYGSCCISRLFIPIYIVRNIGQSSVHAWLN